MGLTRRSFVVGATGAAVLSPAALAAARRDPWRAEADAVRATVATAWDAYRAHAWGADELRPVSRTGSSFFGDGSSLGLTIVEALDTFALMGLWEELAEGTAWVRSSLEADQDVAVNVFEATIRLVGGLLSAYGATRDPLFLARCADLADRLLPAFATPTGIPSGRVNLRSGERLDPVVGVAPAVTHIAEFGLLSRLTGDARYVQTSRRAVRAVLGALTPLGLPGSWIDSTTGVWTDTDSTLNPPGDSFLESLWDGWLITGETWLRDAYRTATAATLQRQLSGPWVVPASSLTGGLVTTRQNALAAFYPGLLAQSGDIRRAARLWRAWETERRARGGLLAEWFDPATGEIIDPHAALRPEHVDACLHLWLATREDRYRRAAAAAMRDERARCRTDDGLPCVVDDVRTGARGDLLPAYWWSEQTKYAWLLFHPSTRVDLRRLVLNTEGNVLAGWRAPLRRRSRRRGAGRATLRG